MRSRLVLSSAGLRYTAQAVLASGAIACLHSLVAVQALVLFAFMTPNQDLAFVLAVSYDVMSSLLAGVWVHINNLVSLNGFLQRLSSFLTSLPWAPASKVHQLAARLLSMTSL